MQDPDLSKIEYYKKKLDLELEIANSNEEVITYLTDNKKIYREVNEKD